LSVWGTDKRPMTKMGAALEQIEAAITHFYAGEYACTVTLAGAAEGQMLHPEPDHVWEILKAKSPAGVDEKKWLARFNESLLEIFGAICKNVEDDR
jgi:hypothetical protein